MALTVIIPQAQSATDSELVPMASYTADDTAGPFPVDWFGSAEITLSITSCSGTLNLYVQKRLADGVTYGDIASWTQWVTGEFTTTGQVTLNFINGGNTLRAETDSTLTANSVVTVAFGGYWRIKYDLGGDNPAATFGVYGNFRM